MRMLYGGDYNPDQWPEEVWDEDMRLFRKAHINIATLPVFSWAKLQPAEDRYEFGWLDEILGRLADAKIEVCLATSTGAHPAWMAHRHPDILRVDTHGRKRRFGQRHNSCPHSPTYRTYAPRLASKIAERYHDHPMLRLWHVSNEFGGACYCDRCAAAFRGWLRERYRSLEVLNEQWSTAFWGHTFYDWEEIVPPDLRSERQDEYDESLTAFQAISLDYHRFMSDSLLECYVLERDAVRSYSQDVPITTNLMGAYKPLNYRSWAREMDIVAWDSYPTNREHPANTAFRHALMRGLKDGDPFLLMEQTPSHVNWQPYNNVRRPGAMRLLSYQAVAHGADAVMFFQLRQSRGASEKFHGAVIGHAGHEHTRVFQECADLGAELEQVGSEIVGSRVPADAAILFDWETWWALEYATGPTVDLRYVPQVEAVYRAFWGANISVDVIGVESEFDRYKLLVVPVAYMLHRGQADRLRRFVEGGGTILVSFFSGIVDETDRVQCGGYPAELRSLLGMWVEEHDPLFPDMRNAVVVEDRVDTELAGRHECRLMCERIHSEGAEVIGVYESDFYAGTPALTRNRYGLGEAWYVATDLAHEALATLITTLSMRAGVAAVLETPERVEATRRAHGVADELTFILNHNEHSVEVELDGHSYRDTLTGEHRNRALHLPPRSVQILKRIPGP